MIERDDLARKVELHLVEDLEALVVADHELHAVLGKQRAQARQHALVVCALVAALVAENVHGRLYRGRRRAGQDGV